MTKEEQLGKYPIVANNDGTVLYIDRKSALKAMDEFSKQQCIEFFKFLLPSAPDFDTSIANRYQQFIEQQTENK